MGTDSRIVQEYQATEYYSSHEDDRNYQMIELPAKQVKSQRCA
ncbi:MAG TPA: hypothetical protein PKG92_04685 [Anaerolineaceae bacterium]|jgi:hypothetical protein|nr:hypothetical protein [Anaerolineaceae bacterium]